MTLNAPISPTQSDVQASLRKFLMDVCALPAAGVVAGQPNRVGEPKLTTFAVMTPSAWRRLRTNVDTAVDCKFAGTAAGQVLTVAEIFDGAIVVPGSQLSGRLVPVGTRIGEQATGDPGSTGTYAVDSDLDIPNQQTFGAGSKVIEIASEVTVGVGYHSEDYAASALAQTFSAAFRDEYGVGFFRDLDPRISPLYADDPVMRPFVNAEQQFEWFLVIDAKLQVNQTIRVPLEFADAVDLFVVSVEAMEDEGGALRFDRSRNSQFLPGGL